MLERLLHTRQRRPDKRNDASTRGSIADSRLSVATALLAVILTAAEESRIQSGPEPHEEVKVTSRLHNSADLLAAIKRELGGKIAFDMAWDDGSEGSPGDANTALQILSKAICASPAISAGLLTHPAETTKQFYRAGKAAATYGQVQQEGKDNTEEVLCNSHTHTACDRLEALGLPMYIVSICPHDLSQSIQYPPHQVAVCKINDGSYLIINNNETATLWQGPLFKHFRQNTVCPMDIVPVVGIAKYQRPVHPNSPIARMLVQARSRVPDEEAMVSLASQLNPDNARVASAQSGAKNSAL